MAIPADWRPALGALGRRTLNALLPPRCLSCGAGVEAPGSLCAACWGGLTLIGAPVCAACGYPFDYDLGPDALCAACTRERPRYDRARAVLRYDEASRRLLLGFKHADRTEGAPAFAGWLARAGAGLLAEAEVIVPVPLHRWRLVALLPPCKITLKAAKPTPYPKEPRTVGDHLKRRRYELGLSQKEVRQRLQVGPMTLGRWENNKTTPQVRYLPRIIEFLGYDPCGEPQNLGAGIAAKRRALGLSRKRLARRLGMTEATVAGLEKGTLQLTGRRRAIVDELLSV